ncbi:7392_t:CDS:1 [Ambispora leptoticha]|uniref:7392_t:CDS:1 n=1 Tax=Ambispora leptoticha TaxID=144679 RepID=A0A9N8W8M2_9GLOM|nr:7392_t:CDS:1 [Ambispora leptoticha]
MATISNILTRRDTSLSDTKDSATFIILGLIIGLFLLLGILIVIAIVRARAKKAKTTTINSTETSEVVTTQQQHHRQAKDPKLRSLSILEGQGVVTGKTTNIDRRASKTTTAVKSGQERNSNGSTLVGLPIRDSLMSTETFFTSPRASREIEEPPTSIVSPTTTNPTTTNVYIIPNIPEPAISRTSIHNLDITF